MGEVAPTPTLGQEGRPRGPEATCRGGPAAGRELACPSRTDTQADPGSCPPPYETGQDVLPPGGKRTERVIYLFSHLTVNSQVAFSTFTAL